MAIQAPTFAAIALCTTSQRQTDGPVSVRALMEHVPGVDGQFVQPHGHGGRNIDVAGVLHTTAEADRATALATARDELRTKEGLADGATVGDYIDTAGVTISNCILMSYAPMGPIEIVPDSTNFKGIIRIRAVIRELNP